MEMEEKGKGELGPRGKNRNLKNVYGNVLWDLYFYANCNAHTQILRTVKDFAERFTFLPAFRSNVPFLSARSRILCVLQIFHFRNRIVFLFEVVDDLL